jgi:hypothetical protein
MPFAPISMTDYFMPRKHTQYQEGSYLDDHSKHEDGPKLELMHWYSSDDTVVDCRASQPKTPMHDSYYSENPQDLWMNHLDQPEVNDKVALDYINKKLEEDDDWTYMLNLCYRMAKDRIERRVQEAEQHRSRPTSPNIYLTPRKPESEAYTLRWNEETRRRRAEGESHGESHGEAGEIEDFMRSLAEKAREQLKERENEKKRMREEIRLAGRAERENEQRMKYHRNKKRLELLKKQTEQLRRENAERKKHNYILARDCTGLARWVIENEDVHIPEDVLYLEDCDYPNPIDGFHNPQTLFTHDLRPYGGFPCDNRPMDCACFNFEAEILPKTVIFNTQNGRGLGLKALRDIKKGEYIGEFRGLISVYDNNETDPVKLEGLRTQDMRYAIGGHWDASTDFGVETDGTKRNFSYYIDALNEGTETRFINHHCDPAVVNCEYIEENHKRRMLTVVRATKFIKEGDEILLDYGAYDDWTALEGHCLCGSAKCRFDPTKNYPPTYVRLIDYPGKGLTRVTISAAKPKHMPFIATARIERKRKKRTYHIWLERKTKEKDHSRRSNPAPIPWPAPDTRVHIHIHQPAATPKKLRKTGLGHWRKHGVVSRGRDMIRRGWMDEDLRREEEALLKEEEELLKEEEDALKEEEDALK